MSTETLADRIDRIPIVGREYTHPKFGRVTVTCTAFNNGDQLVTIRLAKTGVGVEFIPLIRFAKEFKPCT